MLIIEDGSVVAGANSFATVAQVRAFAALRGFTLPVDDSAIEILLVRAADYLAYLESRFAGVRTDPAAQSLCFPRVGVYLFGTDLASDVIPVALVQGQIALAIHANALPDLLPKVSGRIIKREKLDVIETEYQESTASNPVPFFPDVEAILTPLFGGTDGGSMQFDVMRV